MKTKDKFSRIIHYNRDENSFTARLFESYLFPYWHNNKSEFNSFVQALKVANFKSQSILNNKFKRTDNQAYCKSISNESYSFVDGMLFLENLDIYAYCKANDIRVGLSPQNIDKTEFDCVIVAETKDGCEVLFVFEIKCFSNFKKDEIIRQIQILNHFKHAGLFKEFYHFSIISEENFSRGHDLLPSNTIPLTFLFNYIKDFVKPTWQRFYSDIEFECLYCRVTKGGIQFNPRKLIDRSSI